MFGRACGPACPGLAPLTTYDQRATPMYDAFTATPNLAPFDAIVPKIDIEARNATTAYRAADARRLDFSAADRIDEGTLNDLLWHAVRGAGASPPPYGSFARD